MVGAVVDSINPYTGASVSSGLGNSSFDFSGLATYFAAGANLNTNLQAAVLMQGPLGNYIRQKDALDITPPWQDPAQQVPKNTDAANKFLRDEVQSPDKLFSNNKSLTQPGMSDTAKNLFSLYQALSRVQALTSIAQTSSGQAQAASLQKKLDLWLQQVKDFTNNSTFTGVTMVPGLDTAVAQSTIARKTANPVDLALGLAVDNVHKGAKIADVRSDPIPGLTGTETFRVTVIRNGVTTNIDMDLANAASTAIDDVVTYLNAQMTGNGMSTTFKVLRNSETSYALQVVGSKSESVSFSNPSNTEGAVYIAGKTGGASFADGFVTKFDALDAGTDQSFYKTVFTQDGDTANAVAVDSQGYVYTVGTTAGSLDNQVATGHNDVFLTKHDAAGRVVYTRMLGSAADANGTAISIDANDNVIVAGQAFGKLTPTQGSSNAGVADSFITKFSSNGEEQWTKQLSAYNTDGATSLAIDLSGNVFVAGFTYGNLDGGNSSSGARDAYFLKLDSKGKQLYSQQFGTAGDDVASAVTVDAGGHVYVAGVNNGRGFVRRYDDAGNSAALAWTKDVGSVGIDGNIAGIAVDSNGDPIVTGTSSNNALSATVIHALTGGADGFAMKLDATTGADQWVSYMGGLGNDTVHGMVLDSATNQIYLTGETDNVLPGETDQPGAVDGFLARFDSAGTVDYAKQFGASSSHRGMGIAFDPNGTNSLSRLGLPEGALFPTESLTVTSQTTARAGQYFFVNVDGKTHTRVTLSDKDTLTAIANRINLALGTAGKAKVKKEGSVERLSITAANGREVVLKAGGAGFDALRGLGLKEARLVGAPKETDEKALTVAKAGRFALGLNDDINVRSKKAAADAKILVDNALRELRDAYKFTVVGYQEPKPTVGPTPPAMAAKIAAYKDALNRLNSGGGGGVAGL